MMSFLRHVLRLPWPWVAWLGLLVAANMVAPLFFLDALEAKLALSCIVAGLTIMLAVFRARGFVRLLGVGHAPWLLLVPFLALRLGEHAPASPVRAWMIAVIVLDSVSLAIDVTDVVRYARGDRAPQVVDD